VRSDQVVQVALVATRTKEGNLVLSNITCLAVTRKILLLC